jgi:hypothetical protein
LTGRSFFEYSKVDPIMSYPSRIVLALFLLSPLAGAEIFKCAGENGAIVYQNFRCELDSIGSSATAPMPAESNIGSSSAKPASALPSPIASAQVPAQPAASPAPFIAATTGKYEPRIGMTARQVRHLSWGEPIDISKSEGATGVETWTYSGNRVLRFDESGRVAAIQH